MRLEDQVEVQIISKETWNGLEMAITLAEDGEHVEVWPAWLDSPRQRWYFVEENDGKTVALVSVAMTNRAIVYRKNNSALGIAHYDQSAPDVNREFVYAAARDGYYRFEWKKDRGGQIFDINGGNAIPGKRIYTWNNNGGANQLWRRRVAPTPAAAALESVVAGAGL